MKSTPLTQGITMLVLVIYVLYSFFALPFAGFLLSLAVGLMSYGGLESFEMSVSLMIISGVMYSLISKQTIREPTAKGKEGFADLVDPLQISKRVKEIRKEIPKGVYASSFAEGFADADTDSNADGEKEKKAMVAATEAASKPASASGSGEAGSGIDPVSLETSGFKGSAEKNNGEFKLGVLPDEGKGGYHIDQGTTVINALNALKPDQIKAMSADTQKLIDTQKSLMSMLSTMKPMLQDGKQMMNNFQEMFGKSPNGQFKLA